MSGKQGFFWAGDYWFSLKWYLKKPLKTQARPGPLSGEYHHCTIDRRII